MELYLSFSRNDGPKWSLEAPFASATIVCYVFYDLHHSSPPTGRPLLNKLLCACITLPPTHCWHLRDAVDEPGCTSIAYGPHHTWSARSQHHRPIVEIYD